MSAEQTELLRQILAVQKEQLAFAQRQREEFLALQIRAIETQGKGLRMSRVALLILFMVLAFFVAVIFLSPGPKNDDQPNAPVPGKKIREI